ncbi:hypothetical protein SPHINGO391_350375 [Sphingomonas aurantiaca]|uniref:Uncharacterized protein n=1 Tax=Sphingomonas aurantiaca TaxID=185949 RepID=A0A5E7Y748_9SPHN|nr:hypothetical protein SPHINGO391_350375 [Sphingomonas aurantiaca]
MGEENGCRRRLETRATIAIPLGEFLSRMSKSRSRANWPKTPMAACAARAGTVT